MTPRASGIAAVAKLRQKSVKFALHFMNLFAAVLQFRIARFELIGKLNALVALTLQPVDELRYQGSEPLEFLFHWHLLSKEKNWVVRAE